MLLLIQFQEFDSYETQHKGPQMPEHQIIHKCEEELLRESALKGQIQAIHTDGTFKCSTDKTL